MIIPTKFSKLYLQTHAMIDAILAPNKGLSVNRVVFMQPMLLCFVVYLQTYVCLDKSISNRKQPSKNKNFRPDFYIERGVLLIICLF